MTREMGFEGTGGSGGGNSGRFGSTTSRFPRLTELPEPQAPSWLPRVAGTVFTDVQHTPGLPRARDLPSPTRRRVGSTGLLVDHGPRAPAHADGDLFQPSTLTPDAVYTLPFVKTKRLRTQVAHAEDGGEQAGNGVQYNDAVASISARFVLPKKPMALPGGSKRKKKDGATLVPLEQRRDEEEEEEAGLADAAFISDPAAAKAAREQLEQHMLEAEEDEMVPGIETDDDVVQFYARYGQDSEVSSRHKFFYCVPVESGLEYLPYDLRVVRMDKGRLEKGEMYYTMSATGVMKIFKGVQSEFMSLAEWVREKTHFRMWRRTPFFRNNVVAQMFQQWTMTVRRRKFERKRAQLQRTLFLAQPTFCSPICELLKVIDEIRSLDLARLTPPTGKEARDNPLDTTPGKNSGHIHPGTELKQYVRKQTEIRELELEAINNRMQRVQSILEAVCREAQKQAKLYRESIRDLKELKDTTGVDLYQRAGEKHRSMVAIREEKVQRAETYHRVMHEAERLPFFVRLADYMTCEALIEQAVWTAEWMVHVLHNTRAPPERPYLVPGFDDATPATTLGKKMFITYARYADEGGMAFEPDQGDFEGALLGVVDGVLATVSSVVPVIKMRAFGQYFSSRLEGLTVGQVIRQSPRFVAARDAITEIVAADFVAAGEHVSQYEQYAAIKAFYDTWDHTQYNLAEATRESMFSDLMENKGHFNSVKNKIKSMHQTGVLQVDARRDIKEVLLPKVTQAYEDLKMKMHEKFKQMVAEQRRNFQLRVDFLEKRPDEKDLELFFAYKRAIDTDFRAKANDFKNEFAEVERLFETLTSDPINMALPDVDRGDYHDLSNLVDRFGEALEAGDEFCRNRTSDFTAHVEIQIRQVKDAVEQLSIQVMQKTSVQEEDTNVAEIIASLDAMQRTLADLKRRAKRLLLYKHTFAGMEDLAMMEDESAVLAEISTLEGTEKDLQEGKEIWTLYTEFQSMKEVWMHGNVKELDMEEIGPRVQDFWLRTKALLKATRKDTVLVQLQQEIADFKEHMHVVLTLANPALEDRHWQEIFAILGDPFFDAASPDYQFFSVALLMDKGVEEALDKVQVVSAAATKEWSLKNAMKKMEQEWQGKEFKVQENKETKTYTLGSVEEIQAILDDQLVKIQSMLASPYIKPLQAHAEEWADRLNTLQSIIDNQLTCQQTWQYLEPIFSSGDIMNQMPEETRKFQKVDTTYRDIMHSTWTNSDCLKISMDKERLEELKNCNELLEEIEKGLAEYLEVKRVAFPRFFFLSDDAMLEILSQTKDPTRVQPHLSKCFEGIAKLAFKGHAHEITAMQSIEGETVPFIQNVLPKDAQGAVEKWLGQTEAAMFSAVREACVVGIEEYANVPRIDWVLNHPGQVVLVVTAIDWTRQVEEALSGKAGDLKAYADRCTEQLNDVVGLVRGELTKLSRATLSALVVMDVHARDVVAELGERDLEGQGTSPFAWQAQLRMYWEEGGAGSPFEGQMTIPVRMMNASVEYGYEYLGNSARLVVTPLTDRCYRTLMGAIHLNLGGAPEGPAGTGKTETTKDLAKALARQCVVYNCSDSLDYLTMAKFFKGLATSGAWACFDEFNRINLEVLSVVAQQVLDIQVAVRAKKTRFFFEGSELPLKPTCNVFITMNPGYAGRSELPDNLKALFRTVAMMVPDYAMIAEIILYSYGYLLARDSARKIVATYKLCSEQLSSQDHYDYGMRAVMAVLRAAGNLKRKFPDTNELQLMLRSIVDVNQCKFLAHDIPLFRGIVSDLFPGIVLPEPDYTSLEAMIKERCEVHNLQPTPYFMTKTIQLYEMIIVRHGLMIVGLPFSGKSSSLNVLAESLSALKEKGVSGTLFEHVKMEVLNPKSVYRGDLYGEVDSATLEWRDGVLGVAFRKLADPTDESSDKRWVILDGPVDAVWIENMNTVLDDNKKLCLPNSEIIAMHPNQSMIFEVGDLKAASPATVSRCGMVYLEPHQLGWAPLVRSWRATLPADYLGEDLADRAENILLWLLPPLLRFVATECRETSPTSPTNLAQATMRLLSALLAEFRPLDEDTAEPTEDGTVPPPPGASLDVATRRKWVDGLALFSLVWSVGCTGDGASREVFDKLLRAILAGETPEEYKSFVGVDHIVELTCPDFPASLAGTPVTVYDVVFDKTTAEWRRWIDTLDAAAPPEDGSFTDVIVPTAELARVTFLLDEALQDKYPMLLVGPSGTGKSVYMRRHLLQGLPKDEWVQVFINFSARTTAGMAQEQVDSRLDKRRKGYYGPPVGQRCVVFVDDLNMPAKEEWGAQPPIELLRQFMDFSGWYMRDGKTWLFKHLQDVQIVGAMGPPGGGRTFITDRFLRHMSCVALTDPDSSTLTHIFHTILDQYLTKLVFPDAITELSSQIIASTQQIYSNATRSLLPTPAKSHYMFNLRDFARVVHGVMLLRPNMLPKDAVSAPRYYKRLFVHEILRVFYDRLIDDTDRMWLLGEIRKAVAENMDENLEDLFPHLLDPSVAAEWPKKAAKEEKEGEEEEEGTPTGTHTEGQEEGEGEEQPKVVGLEHLRRVFFTDLMDTDEETEKRGYQEVQDVPALVSTIERYLTEHNDLSKRPMSLAVFLFACEHISRICRVLKQPGGNMLLVGVGGSGRQSLTRLASFIMGMDCRQVEISKNYTKSDWYEDLKMCLKQAGADMKPTVFLFSDTQIKDESFVEDINNILNSGEVPNMFPADEKMGILEAVRPHASKKGLETPLELWGFFTDACRQNLHVVLCLSPIGDAFRERLRQNPSLINCCNIDWFQTWPDDALEAVARKSLSAMDLGRDQRAAITAVCKGFHRSLRGLSERYLQELGRYNYVTPTSYLELLSLFQSLLDKKRQENRKMQDRYLTGLEKLKSAQEDVAKLSEELKAKQPILKETVTQVEQMLVDIAKEKKDIVEPQAAAVKEEEEAAKAVAAEAKELKDGCDAELAVAMPILNDALAALNTVKDEQIQYIRKLPNPPAVIKTVMHAVCIVLGEKPVRGKDESGKTVDDWWKTSVNLLGRKTFLEEVQSFDKDKIDPKVIAKIRETFTSDETFTPEAAKKASPAAEGLCKWVHAMDKYEEVAKKVAPLRESAAVASAKYEKVMEGLRAKQKELKMLLDKLALMEQQLAEAQERKASLEHEVELTSVKLDRAEKLIGGLGGEQQRWSQTADKLKEAYTNLTGDMLISAGIVGYLGAFTSEYRAQVGAQWQALLRQHAIPCSDVISMQAVLGNPVQIREWLLQGLPNDSFSIDNAIIVENARRWPLMIDPQGQGVSWIKAMYRKDNLQVIKLSDGVGFLRTLENAIQFGLPVLLENIEEELDPALEPLLLKQTFVQNNIEYIRLGDSTIEYSSDFTFFMTTKLRNPHYLPEIAVKVTLLNFMITPLGLSDQMLNVVVGCERPDLEQQRDELIRKSAANKKKLQEIEDEILRVLSESEGNILDDETAISTIADAKHIGKEIEESQAEAEKTEKEIDVAREAYKTCGEYTSLLFFCITDLGTADPMYQYSLGWFVNLFVGSIMASAPAPDVADRLINIQEHFTYSLYKNVCRSLFEKDKLLFSFLLSARIEQAKGRIASDEWLFLLTGGLGDPGDHPNPARSWLLDRSWKEIIKLSRLDPFRGMDTAVVADPTSWKAIYDSEEPHTVPLPGNFNNLSPFHKVLVIRCLRLDKVTVAVQDYVSSVLGQRYVVPPPFNLHECYEDSAPHTPLIFVLSAGSDPTALLQQFATEKGMESRLKNISLGDGQGPKAEKLIMEGRSSGDWVVLFNCHLAPSWMPTLDKLCEGLEKDKDKDKIHPEFRLWLTSYPSPKFPVNVLQNGIKMVMEPPKGIRANMRRTYMLEPVCNDDFFDESTKPKEFKCLLFGLAFMHALVQERRKFGPLGWNVQYSFDDSDLKISVQQLRMFIDESDEVPFKALRYVTGECNYGGRVTDDKDRILLNTLMEMCYSTAVIREPGHPLSASGIYRVPEPGPRDSYLEYIETLPIIPAPEAFGLHQNADITKDQNDTLRMFRTLLDMGGGGGGGDGASGRDEVVRTLVDDCLQRMPPRFDIEKAQDKYKISYTESLNTVLVQEMERYNRLTDVIRESLKGIDLALQGLQVMSAELDSAFRAISINQVPDLWRGASYPTLKPLAGYLEDLYKRLEMLQEWYEKGQPSVFWISGFYFVHSFLAAPLQNYARKHKVPIDEVAYDFRMMGMDPADYPAKPEDGAYIHGLFLEGCAWDPDNSVLCESEPKVLFTKAPCIHLIPTPVDKMAEAEAMAHYKCPIYRTAERRGTLATTGHSTNFVMFARVPSSEPSSHWTLRGVCMLCSLSSD